MSVRFSFSSFARVLRKRRNASAVAWTQSDAYRAALLQAIMDASADGIVVVSLDRRIVAVNPRMVEMWQVPPDVIASGSDEIVAAWAADQVADPDAFTAKVDHLYDHPDERSWDEVVLKNGFVFERYSAPVVGADGARYCR